MSAGGRVLCGVTELRTQYDSTLPASLVIAVRLLLADDKPQVLILPIRPPIRHALCCNSERTQTVFSPLMLPTARRRITSECRLISSNYRVSDMITRAGCERCARQFIDTASANQPLQPDRHSAHTNLFSGTCENIIIVGTGAGNNIDRSVAPGVNHRRIIF